MKLLAAPVSAMRLPGGGRTRPILAAAAILTAALVIMGPDGSPEAAAVASTSRRAPATEASAGAMTRTSFTMPERATAEPGDESVFSSHTWYVAPPPKPVVYQAPPKPVAPPLPYAYMGQFAEQGGKTVYYLVRGDRVYDVRVGDTLDNTYSVDSAGEDQIVFTYKPLDERQTLALGR